MKALSQKTHSDVESDSSITLDDVAHLPTFRTNSNISKYSSTKSSCSELSIIKIPWQNVSIM